MLAGASAGAVKCRDLRYNHPPMVGREIWGGDET